MESGVRAALQKLHGKETSVQSVFTIIKKLVRLLVDGMYARAGLRSPNRKEEK
jgi:hypothetical protein